MSFIYFKKLHPDAVVPQRGSEFAAGYDLTSIDTITVAPGEVKLVATGIACALPHQTYGRIAPRSGMSVKTGLMINAGVIDEDYRGEIKICAQNPTQRPIEIVAGMRVAQMVIERVMYAETQEVEELPKTSRGACGFGSTGGI